jgi:hypothetical protein
LVNHRKRRDVQKKSSNEYIPQIVSEPLDYGKIKTCHECEHKQEIIDLQLGRIKALTELVETKNELIDNLKDQLKYKADGGKKVS